MLVQDLVNNPLRTLLSSSSNASGGSGGPGLLLFQDTVSSSASCFLARISHSLISNTSGASFTVFWICIDRKAQDTMHRVLSAAGTSAGSSNTKFHFLDLHSAIFNLNNIDVESEKSSTSTSMITYIPSLSALSGSIINQTFKSFTNSPTSSSCNILIVMDSLSTLTLAYTPAHIATTLRSLLSIKVNARAGIVSSSSSSSSSTSSIVSIVASWHLDLPCHSSQQHQQTAALIQDLSSLVVTLSPLNDIIKNKNINKEIDGAYEVVQQRLNNGGGGVGGGKMQLERETGYYTFATPKVLFHKTLPSNNNTPTTANEKKNLVKNATVSNKPPPPPSSSSAPQKSKRPISSFSLGLTEEERQQRAAVELPFMKAQLQHVEVEMETTTQFKESFYSDDEGDDDDDDDEDPDADLEF